MLVHCRVTLSSKFAGTHLYTWVKRGTVRVKCLAQEHNPVPQLGLKTGQLDPGYSALTIRPPGLQQRNIKYYSLTIWKTFDDGVNLANILTTFYVFSKFKHCSFSPLTLHINLSNYLKLTFWFSSNKKKSFLWKQSDSTEVFPSFPWLKHHVCPCHFFLIEADVPTSLNKMTL